MKKKYLRVISSSLLLATITLSGCSCHINQYKITFVSEGNSDIVKYVGKGKSLVDIPLPGEVKGKYCVWDRDDFHNIESDLVVHANCYSKVTNLEANLDSVIDVEVSSSEADLDYILKDLQLEATLESGEVKKLYQGDYTINTNGYNKDVSGSYQIEIRYNDAVLPIQVNVNKIDNYVTVSLNGAMGYYNEGLPTLIAHTDVEGTISFDPNQVLYVGVHSYNWTFTPSDLQRYQIVKGSINVELISARNISANKESIEVDFGTTKSQIIDLITQGLVVEGYYGITSKVIEPKFYTIDCPDFVVNRSGSFTFTITYDRNITTTITVNVNKCETYDLIVDEVEEFILKENTSVQDLSNVLTKQSSVDGVLSLDSNQVLLPGIYEYNYTFTPNNSNYAIKKGKVRVHIYKASRMKFTTTTNFKYGSSLDDILEQLKSEITGNIIYNDDLTKQIDKEKISVSMVDNYQSLVAKEYTYHISYNDEIEMDSTFTLDKRALVKDQDYTIMCDKVDYENYQTLPVCRLIVADSNEIEFDPSQFHIVQVADAEVKLEDFEQYVKITYEVEIIPDESLLDNYQRVKTTIICTYVKEPSGPRA